MKLTIELVPKTAWYTNVRSNVPKTEWDRIRKKSYALAGHVCEICGDTGLNQGYKHPVECHEIFEYNDDTHVQKLVKLVSLCPICHKVKHPGLAQMNGEQHLVLEQLQKVNKISLDDAVTYLSKSFDLWRKRSKVNWTLDLEYLNNF